MKLYSALIFLEFVEREKEREDKNKSLLLIKRQEDRSHYSFFLGDLFVFRERERERGQRKYARKWGMEELAMFRLGRK